MGILNKIFWKRKEGPRNEATVSVLMADGGTKPGKFTYFPIYAGRFTRGACCLSLEVDGVTVAEGKAHSYFHALLALRGELEARHTAVLCWGAGKGVWPTGMQADMGVGLTASRRKEDGSATEEKSIFDPIDVEQVSTVSEQKRFAGRMMANVMKRNKKRNNGNGG